MTQYRLPARRGEKAFDEFQYTPDEIIQFYQTFLKKYFEQPDLDKMFDNPNLWHNTYRWYSTEHFAALIEWLDSVYDNKQVKPGLKFTWARQTDGEYYVGELVGFDLRTKLAILQTDKKLYVEIYRLTLTDSHNPIYNPPPIAKSADDPIDFLGQDIKIKDLVIVANGNNDLRFGIIAKINPKTVKVNFIGEQYPRESGPKPFRSIIVVNDLEMAQLKLVAM